jgi:hypothetical protein
MPKFIAEACDAEIVEMFFADYPDLDHLRVRRRADLLTLESGSTENLQRHARLRRVTVHLWRLEMPAGSSRWSATPFRDQLNSLLEMLVRQFPWTLA